MNALAFHRFLGRRTARCLLAWQVVSSDSCAGCGCGSHEEAMPQVSMPNRKSRHNVHFAREEDKQSDWVEGHATEACALTVSL